MITEAIFMQRKYMKGSSRDEIRTYISDKYDLDYHKIKGYIASNLSKMLETDSEDNYSAVVRVGKNYKLHPEWRKEWTKMYGIKQKRRRRKKRPSDFPKQSRSAYLFFSIDARKKAQDKYPDKKFGDITKEVAKEWKKVKKDKSRKRKYERMAEKDKERYEREINNYKAKRSYSSDSYSSTSDSEERSKSRRRRSRKSRSESEESKPKRRKRVKRSLSSSSEESEKGKKQKTESTNDEKKLTDKKV